MDPEKYAIYSKQQRANGFQLFVENFKYISQIPVAGRALDIGCGTGDVAKLLTFFTNLGSIIGLDHSADMIEVARRRADDARMSFTVGDVQQADQLPGGKFHLITAFAVMHWLADQESGLKNIYNCLDDSGVFVAHIWCGSDADWAMFDVLKQPKWMPHFKQGFQKALGVVQNQPWMHISDPAKCYSALLVKAGFTIHQCETRLTPSYINERELQGYVRAMTGRSVEGLSSDAFEDFIWESIAAFKSKLPTPISNQYWQHTGRRIYVVARK